MMSTHLSKDTIYKIREEILKGKSKFQVAKDMKISDSTVYKHTKDLPNKYKREPYISGKPLELLKQLLRDGFVYTGKNRNKLRFLQRIFPVIESYKFLNEWENK